MQLNLHYQRGIAEIYTLKRTPLLVLRGYHIRLSPADSAALPDYQMLVRLSENECKLHIQRFRTQHVLLISLITFSKKFR